MLASYLHDGLSLERIGDLVGRHPSTVGYWVQRHGLEAVNRDRHLPKGIPSRERLETLIGVGMTQLAIAETFGVGVSTVRYWLRKYELKTAHGEQYGLSRDAKLPRITRRCRRHGMTTFVISGAAGRYRCQRCRSEAVTERRRKVKRILVAEAGGCCRICGYSRWPSALQFHHVDASEKSFNLSLQGESRSLAAAREEARKCVLLCANCHAEVEAGRAILPADARANES